MIRLEVTVEVIIVKSWCLKGHVSRKRKRKQTFKNSHLGEKKNNF